MFNPRRHNICKTASCRTSFLPKLSVGLAALIMLTSCKDDDLMQVIDKIKSINNDATEPTVCQSHSAPFSHTLCSVSQHKLTAADSTLSLHLFWKSGQWQMTDTNPAVDQQSSLKPLYKFDNLLQDLPQGSDLKFAANAGMYNSDFAPIGYTVIKGQQIMSLNLKQGGGNFHLLPNGVLWWDKQNHIHITESHQFSKLMDNGTAKPWYATQSGPMLVIDGEIHPKFNVESQSIKIRNGVGVCDDGNVQFVTSHEPVNFYQFANYFKQDLHCHNALFLDGGIASSLYAPEVNYKDDKNMGVIIGLIENKRKN